MIIKNECPHSGLIAGIILADDVVLTAAKPAQMEELEKLAEIRNRQEFPSGKLKQSVRSMLKDGGFKPTGRNKPASEYLAQSAREERFPFINNLVDINNYLSLFSGLPMTILDRDITGENLNLRLGREGESYIFNPSGQEIDLSGLICICNDDGPLGNPVKDSMKAKVTENTKNIIAVIYAPSDYFDCMRIEELCRMFASKLIEYAQAKSTAVMVV